MATIGTAINEVWSALKNGARRFKRIYIKEDAAGNDLIVIGNTADAVVVRIEGLTRPVEAVGSTFAGLTAPQSGTFFQVAPGGEVTAALPASAQKGTYYTFVNFAGTENFIMTAGSIFSVINYGDGTTATVDSDHTTLTMVKASGGSGTDTDLIEIIKISTLDIWSARCYSAVDGGIVKSG